MFIGTQYLSGADKIDAVLSAALFFYCLFVPYAMYRFLRIYKTTLGTYQIKRQFLSLYTQVDIYNILALNLNLILMYRKFFIIVIVILLQAEQSFQLLMMIHLQLFTLIIIIRIRPMKGIIA